MNHCTNIKNKILVVPLPVRLTITPIILKIFQCNTLVQMGHCLVLHSCVCRSNINIHLNAPLFEEGVEAAVAAVMEQYEADAHAVLLFYWLNH